MDFELIPKIIGLILAVAGIIGLIITAPTLFGSSPNITGCVASVISLAGSGAILKLFSDS